MSSPLLTTLAEVRAAQRGERAAMESLFARYWPRVMRVVALRVGRSVRECGDIEDLAQEAMLKAFRFFDRFDTERSEGTFQNWLARIVENAVRDGIRREAVRAAPSLHDPHSGVAEPAAADPRPSQMAQGRELEDRIEQVLLRLPERLRELLILRDRCGMSYGEVAESLGLKNGDVARALHHRALRALGTALECSP